MGVRPPQNGDDDEPDTITFGIAALDAHLENADVQFPTDQESLLIELGDPDIPYDASGSTVALSTAMERIHLQQFDSEQELLNTLHPVFESYRERAGNSIIGQLRALLPF
ncbi:hypothetical protein [Haloglomus litoreum]|uniref:hypothetical protein n=1 Tax=Haloglomus litoreum TaxID=3034026 RepID=UPI0023E89D5A|nr:hypothetical protein [Haloglomus sp. DT116]